MEILLVTEHAPSAERRLIQHLLADHDVQSVSAKSYKQAVEHLAKHKNRVVILYCFDGQDDFTAPEAIRIMKGIVPNLLVIAVSCETSLEIERELRTCGLYFHLSSPIEEQELKEVLIGALERGTKRSEL